MLHRVDKNFGIPVEPLKRDPLQRMHRRLAWALGTATGALVINTMAVIALVEGG